MAAQAQASTITEVVTHIARGRHHCLIYETEDEQFRATLPYLKQGLDRGEYCFYIVDEHTAESVRDAMSRQGINVDGAVNQGQFALMTKQETYLLGGQFDPDRMIEFVRQACERARAAGFPAIRGTGEMTWHLGSDATLEQLLIYESKLTDDIFCRYPIAGICQYNLQRFGPEFLRGILETHPIVIYKDVVCDNYYYIPRDEFLAEQVDTHAQFQRMLKILRDSARQRQELLNAVEAQKNAEGQAIDRLGELEQFQEVTVGRELQMIALEREIETLKRKLKEALGRVEHRGHA
jgi:chemotaxis family two-component system sensor kinase Cph1